MLATVSETIVNTATRNDANARLGPDLLICILSRILVEPVDCLGERIFVSESTAAVQDVFAGIKKDEMRYTGNAILCTGCFVLIDIDNLEINVSIF